MRARVSLPNGATVEVESEDRQEAEAVLRVLLRELAGVQRPATRHQPPPERTPEARPQPAEPSQEPTPGTEAHFVRFCREHDPGNHMRRTVVLAEGARRFLGKGQVSIAELGRLFTLVGWPLPSNLVQTVRNAARSEYGWLRNVPGRQGFYTVTAEGVAEVLGEAP